MAAVYTLFLRTDDPTLFKGARLLQVEAGTLDQLLAGLSAKLLQHEDDESTKREFSVAAADDEQRLLQVPRLRLLAEDGHALTPIEFNSLPDRGRYRVERSSVVQSQSDASSQRVFGPGFANTERASVLAARTASTQARSRELVVRLDYAAWRAAVLAKFKDEPGFEALRWKNGQQAVVRFANDVHAAAVLNPSGQKRAIVQAPLEVLPADTEATTAHCVLPKCHPAATAEYRWLLDAHTDAGASGVLHAIRKAINCAQTKKMPAPCRARLVFADSGLVSHEQLCAWLVLGFVTAEEADAAVQAAREHPWAFAPNPLVVEGAGNGGPAKSENICVSLVPGSGAAGLLPRRKSRRSRRSRPGGSIRKDGRPAVRKRKRKSLPGPE
jgi:hypothetical protein|eukprot:COSAG02_NODE_7601_length_2940_cov_2.219366_3_plen_384_part_00